MQAGPCWATQSCSGGMTDAVTPHMNPRPWHRWCCIFHATCWWEAASGRQAARQTCSAEPPWRCRAAWPSSLCATLPSTACIQKVSGSVSGAGWRSRLLLVSPTLCGMQTKPMPRKQAIVEMRKSRGYRQQLVREDHQGRQQRRQGQWKEDLGFLTHPFPTTPAVLSSLFNHARQAQADPHVRAIVVTGADGEPPSLPVAAAFLLGAGLGLQTGQQSAGRCISLDFRSWRQQVTHCARTLHALRPANLPIYAAF